MTAPPTKKQWTAFSKILKMINDRPDAAPFREPVAWRELGLMDYPQLIKKPMVRFELKMELTVTFVWLANFAIEGAPNI
jgi:hypothetical protein